LKPFLKRIVRIALWVFSPLSFLYQILFLIDRFRSKPTRLQLCYVISVGNLTLGGTGKTPFVQFLITTLKKQFPEFHFTILSRGYKARFSNEGTIVNSDAMATDVGDEPLLHKQKLSEVQVIIGKDRIRSYKKFNQISSRKHIVILDDGFQHHKLYRDLDIVLIDANRPIGNGFTLPLGILRERPSALSRADLIVYTKLNENNMRNISALETKERKSLKDIPTFRSKLNVSLRTVEIPKKSSEKYHLITGVGNPISVLESANEILGDKVVSSHFFADHHEYTDSELIYQIKCLSEGTTLLTTEKDWVKWKFLDHFMNQIRFLGVGITLLQIEFELENFSAFESLICSHVSNYAKEIATV